MSNLIHILSIEISFNCRYIINTNYYRPSHEQMGGGGGGVTNKQMACFDASIREFKRFVDKKKRLRLTVMLT